MKPWEGKKVGLALGSGAARGLAHIGILEVFEEEKIPIHFIAGTSIGALIGGFYATGMGIKKLKELAYDTGWKRVVVLFTPSFSRSSLVSGKKIEKLLRSFAGKIKIEELPISFSCVATDIMNGEEIIIKRGDLVDGIMASISIQGILTPRVLNGRILADGGIVNPVPVNIASKSGTNFTIASNVMPPPNKLPIEMGDSKDNNNVKIPNLFSIILQSAAIMQQKMIRDSLSNADLVISPELSNIKLLEFYKAKEAIKIGKKTAKEILKKA